jgi:hypothetical protein
MPTDVVDSEDPPEPWRRCPCCGGPMIIIEILTRTVQPCATRRDPARFARNIGL